MINTFDKTNYQNRIFHSTQIDFTQNIIATPVRLMQYDKTLPIIEIDIYVNRTPYSLPNDASVTMRWSKKDGTFSIIEPIGCDETRQKLYFEVSANMAYFYGDHNPIVELYENDMIAGSTYIPINIERNPVQITDIESSNEYIALTEAVNEAKAAAEYVEEYKDTVIQEITDATDSEIERAQEAVSSAINTFEVGADNQSIPSDSLVLGGIFYKKL